MPGLLSALTQILFDFPPRRDRVSLAIGAIDPVSGALVRDGVSARIAGLTNRAIVNASGMLVFLNLPDQPSYDVEVDARRAGFPFVERFTFVPPAGGDKDPSARRRDVLLVAGPDYPFAPGTTLIRGLVRRGAAPVAGATITAAPAGGGAGFATRSVASGAFALALRLPPSGPHEAEAPLTVRIEVGEGGEMRSFTWQVANGQSHSLIEPIDLAGGNDPGFFATGAGVQAMARRDEKEELLPATRGRPPVPNPPDTPDTRDIKAPPPPEAPEAPAEGEEPAPNSLSDYRDELPALELAEKELGQARTAQIAFLRQLLPINTWAEIAQVHAAPEQRIARLEEAIDARERDLCGARGALAEARRAAAEADLRADFLRHPAAAIRSRLANAQKVLSEAMRASDAGRYAYSYWLVMDGGRLHQAIEAAPALVPADALAESGDAGRERRTGRPSFGRLPSLPAARPADFSRRLPVQNRAPLNRHP